MKLKRMDINMKKMIITGILAIVTVSIVAFAGTTTKTFKYENNYVAKGTLETVWSFSGEDQGDAKTEMTKGKKAITTYLESQDEARGTRTDWDKVTGNKWTKNIAREGVWRFDSSHTMNDSKGTVLVTARQTDW